MILYANTLSADNLLNDAVYNGNISRLDEIIKPNQLMNFKLFELRILRNMIYAKYDYRFISTDLYEYFSRFEWYNGISDNVNEHLTYVDHRNIYLIQRTERNYASFISYDDESIYDLFDILRYSGGIRLMGWSNDGKIFFALADGVFYAAFYIYDLKENKILWSAGIQNDGSSSNMENYKIYIDSKIDFAVNEYDILPLDDYTLAYIDNYMPYSNVILNHNSGQYDINKIEIGLINDTDNSITLKLGEIYMGSGWHSGRTHFTENNIHYLCVKSPFEENIFVLIVILPFMRGGDIDGPFTQYNIFGINTDEFPVPL